MADSEVKTVTVEEFNKQVERAQKFEAKFTDLEKKLERYKDIDPDEYKGIKEDWELMRKEKAKTPEQIDELVKTKETEIRKQVQKEIDDRDGKLKTLSAQVKELQVVDKTFAIGASRFVPEALEDVKDAIRKHCDLDDSGNIIVKGDDGKPRYQKGSTTALMGAKEFIDWLVDTKPHWAKVTASQGVKDKGQTTTSSDNNGVSVEKYLSMTPEERQALPLAVQRKLAPQALRSAKIL